jgi:hypothetical protein
MRRVDRHQVHKGRGAPANPAGRFDATALQPVDDGWGSLDDLPPAPQTTLTAEFPKRARPTSHSSSRSTPTRAASTAASTASHGPRTPT